MHKYSSSIVGARGYTGLELARILLRHPQIQLTHCFATESFSLAKYLGTAAAQEVTCLPQSEIFKNLTDIVFLATPAEVSHELAPKLVEAGCTVIDLSGAYRLKKSNYSRWYHFEHKYSALLEQASYGLVPWVGPMGAKNKGTLISNPGCYASAILMALVPLIKEGLISSENIVIDAKSGATGAGKKAAENLLFTEVDADCLPYRIGKHQHLPEIIECIEALTGVSISPFMSTHLLPIRRGITAGLYLNLNPSLVQLSASEKNAKIFGAFNSYYQNYPLVEFGAIEERAELLSVRRVVGTGKTQIAFQVEGDKLYVFSAIDNLLKGAATQAVENLNRFLDLPIETGINLEVTA